MSRRYLIACVAALACIAGPPAGAAAPQSATVRPAAIATTVRPAAITAKAVQTGLDFPAAFTVRPSGAIWYGEKDTGAIRVIGADHKSNRLFVTVPNVSSVGEQGLLGIALDRHFPTSPFVFVYATRNVSSGLHDQILRIKDVNGHGQDMTVIWSSATTAGQYHDGGHIAFGSDGMLWAVQGEAHDSSNSQDLSNAAGKVLRMTAGGKPAPGDPFPGSRIWSYGLRNSFGFTFDPRTGQLWETENGPECNDELNRIVRGGNFGWGPKENCSGKSPNDTNNSGPTPRRLPLLWYTPTIAPTGVVFCHSCGLGPANEGKLFFGTYNTHNIRRVVLTSNRLGVASQSIVYTHSDHVLSMQAGPGGTIFFSDTGGIFRLTPG